MGIGCREGHKCDMTTCSLLRQIAPLARTQRNWRAEWYILFRGVSSAVHFVTLVIGEKVAMAIFAADRFVLHCVARGC